MQRKTARNSSSRSSILLCGLASIFFVAPDLPLSAQGGARPLRDDQPRRLPLRQEAGIPSPSRRSSASCRSSSARSLVTLGAAAHLDPHRRRLRDLHRRDRAATGQGDPEGRHRAPGRHPERRPRLHRHGDPRAAREERLPPADRAHRALRLDHARVHGDADDRLDRGGRPLLRPEERTRRRRSPWARPTGRRSGASCCRRPRAASSPRSCSASAASSARRWP